MQACRVVCLGPKTVVLEDISIPPPGPGKVMVEVDYSTISPGTELASFNALPNALGTFPMRLGYSAAGRVVQVGQDAALEVGQRVAINAVHASAAVVNAVDCRPVPEAVDLRDASAFRLASIALQGVRKASVQLGHRVAVVGLGIIGNLAGQFVRASGAVRVVGIDPVPWRRELALTTHFDAVEANAASVGEERFDVVIEATGVPAVVNDAFALTRRMGCVVLLGTSRGITEQVDFCNAVHRAGLTVIGAHNAIRPRHEDMGNLWTHASDERTVLDLAATDRLCLAKLISDCVAPDRAAEAYERLTRLDEPLMTIAFDWMHARG